MYQGVIGNLTRLAVLVVFAVACSSAPQPTRIIGQASGVDYTVTLAERQPIDSRQLQQQIETLLAEVNATIASWGGDSELISFGQADPGVWVPVSPQLAGLFALAQQAYRDTNGAFNPSLGPLLRVWGFAGGDPITRPPTPQQVQEALGRVGFDALELTASSARRSKNIDIHLTGLADGYAADAIARLLQRSGYHNFLVEISGELVTGGSKFGQLWKLAIETPDSYASGVQEVIGLSFGQALATSGSYRNFFVSGGKRYQHILDPITGYPADNGVISASVVGAGGALVDAYATACMVLGQQCISMAPQWGVEVLLIIEKDGEVISRSTQGFDRLIMDR